MCVCVMALVLVGFILYTLVGSMDGRGWRCQMDVLSCDGSIRNGWMDGCARHVTAALLFCASDDDDHDDDDS
ncbi:hypothetical protein IWX46DRAFT_606488, partial [Phyllosticta citricarpa]